MRTRSRRWLAGWLGSGLVHACLLAGLAAVAGQDPPDRSRDPRPSPVIVLEAIEEDSGRALPREAERAAASRESRRVVERNVSIVRERGALAVTRPEPRPVPRVSPRVRTTEPSLSGVVVQEPAQRRVRRIRPARIVSAGDRPDAGKPVQASASPVPVTVAPRVAPRVTTIRAARELLEGPASPAHVRSTDAERTRVTARAPSRTATGAPARQTAAAPARPVLRATAPGPTLAPVAAPGTVAASPTTPGADGAVRFEPRVEVRTLAAARPQEDLLTPSRRPRTTSRHPGAPPEIVRAGPAAERTVREFPASRREVVTRTTSRLAGDPGPARDPGWVAHLLRERLSALKGYPQAARLRQAEGRVVLKVVLRHDGHLAEIVVARSSGHNVLDRDAVALLRRASPLPLDRPLGQPYVVLSVPISYQLR